MENTNNTQESPIQILYAIYAIFVAILVVATSKEHGFFYHTFMFLLALVCSRLGIYIGDILRKIAMPDSIFTSGGMKDILMQKLFWFIGPQAIGGFAGGALGATILKMIVE